MVRERIVLGATGDDETARQAARRLRDGGHEVVFVGGGQSVEQIARTAVAEDATRILVDASEDELARVRQLLDGFGVEGVGVEGVDVASSGGDVGATGPPAV